MLEDNPENEQTGYLNSFVTSSQYYAGNIFMSAVGGLTGYLTASLLPTNPFSNNIQQTGALSGIAIGYAMSNNITYSDINRGAITGLVAYGSTILASQQVPQVGKYAPLVATTTALVETKHKVVNKGIELVKDVKKDIEYKSNMILLGGVVAFALLYFYNSSKSKNK